MSKKVPGYWITLFGHQLAMRQYGQDHEADVLAIFRRAAKWVAKNPTDEEAYYDLMSNGYFCPGGRVLAGAGTQHGNVLNCFVQAPTKYYPTTLNGVMELAKKLALVTKVGGGNGTSLDQFIPKDHTVIDNGYEDLAYMNAIAIHEDHPNAHDVLIGLTQDPKWPDNPVRVERGYKRSYVFTYNSEEIITEFPERPEFQGADLYEGLHRLALEAGADRPEMIQVGDSIEEIMNAALDMCTLQEEGVFTCVDLSDLRPEDSVILGSGGTSSGPQAFSVEIYDNFTIWMDRGGYHSGAVDTLRYVMAPTLRCIRQGGTRRGAGMATISVHHPEVLNFMTAKDKDRQEAEGDISTYNISIKATRAFLEAYPENEYIEITDPQLDVPTYLVSVPGKYDVDELMQNGIVEYTERGGTQGHKISARWLMQEIADHAMKFAEPGFMFIDTINDNSASDKKIQSTNPCGEVPLTEGESCDLGAIVLSRYVDVNSSSFDTERFVRDIHTCVKFLDDVLDVNVYALEDNREAAMKYRRLGLGLMGVADTLAALEMEYGSPEALIFLEEIGTIMANESHAASVKLGLERGIPEGCLTVGRRNIATLTVAPTGTTSNLMACSGGIEPFFALSYERRVGGEKVKLIEPVVRDIFNREGYDLTDGEIAALFSKTGTEIDLIDTEYEHLARLMPTSNNIHWSKHVRTQAAVQRGFDTGGLKIGNAISKTINLPRGSTREDVLDAYLLAYEEGCKGITVYVDGSYEDQVLSTSGNVSDTPEPESTDLWSVDNGITPTVDTEELGTSDSTRYLRPTRLYGYTESVKLSDSNGEQQTYLTTVNFDEHTHKPIEVIVVAGKGGSRSHGEAEAIGRLISLSLQSGVTPEDISRSLSGIDAGIFGATGKKFVKSPADLVGSIIGQAGTLDPSSSKETHPSGVLQTGERDTTVHLRGDSGGRRSDACPSCDDGVLIRAEGCLQCEQCGYSKCG